jgi:glycosyltransferase involved in cell wall biosynthesis
MSVRSYGIYLCYPPEVDLRAQGLGRQLAAFLLAAETRADVSFVIACPNWMRGALRRLCDDAGVDFQRLQILAPADSPILLQIYSAVGRIRRRRRRRGLAWLSRPTAWLRRGLVRANTWAEARLAGTRSYLMFVMISLVSAAIILALAVIRQLLAMGRDALLGMARTGTRLLTRFDGPVLARVGTALRNIKGDPGILRLYRHMQTAEVRLLHELIAARPDIAAWYCPTAFWPHFNNIAAPRLMSVPDVVLAEYPIGFAVLGGARFEQTFHDVESAIRGSEHLVTYSEHVKRTTLVERYHVDPERIEVIPHGVNDLSALLSVPDMRDDGTTRVTAYCLTLFRSALHKAIGNGHAWAYGSGDVRYLFYASQLRPNKNALTLLRAYEWLLRRQVISHKLILTGNPRETPSVNEFIAEKGVENDVLFLHGLSERELAACYRLADLAVNPSLSEGGFPFTFAEAVSVGTPVVMARIPVTTEYLGSAPVAASMLFDPYDWRALADRIEWALANREVLYRAQREYFDEIVARRTWAHVVDDHIRALDRISRGAQRADADKLRVHA